MRHQTTLVQWESLSFPHVGRAVLCCLCLLAQVTVAMADSGRDSLREPFSARNLNPFILVHGLPAAGAAGLLPLGESSLQLQLDVSNHSKASDTPEEVIVLDGETYRAALVYKRGIADGWQLGLELPLIAHRPGVMDNFIENWHDLFGLSNKDRDPWPRNRLLFSYTRNGVEMARMAGGSTGLGDLQLRLSRRLVARGNGDRLTFNASLKLPTGDEERFQGSGAADLALWLNGAAPVLNEDWRIGGYWRAGILLLGEGDILPAQQKDHVWFVGAGLHWQPWDWLVLKTQLDTHSSFYDSQLDQLGKRSVLLTFGGSIPLGRGAFDLAIGENLATDTVPDFTLNLAYRWRF